MLSKFSINNWLAPFCLSEKFQFATKVALSLTLAFLIPMSMGWDQGSTAAITVMLIASTGSRRESLAKGCIRVLGTIIGAIIGLTLVAVFAQDRFMYMFCVSVIVSIVFYTRNAYKADPTLFMLTGVVILSMSNGGDAEGAFLYGIDRAFMTSFGVVIFTLVSIFLFPTRPEQNLNLLTQKLSGVQRQLFERILKEHSQTGIKPSISAETQSELTPEVNEIKNEKEENKTTTADLIKALYASQTALTNRYASLSAECSNISAYKKEWDLTIYYYQQITNYLIFAAQNKGSDQLSFSELTENHQTVINNIHTLFDQLNLAWQDEASDDVALNLSQIPLVLNEDVLHNSTHFEKGNIYSFNYLLNKLQERLVRLTETVRCIDSVTGNVDFKEHFPKKPSRFLLWDAENAKTAVKVFLTYWVAGFIWIQFNPPGGYSFVIFSTIYMSLLSFLPIHPKALFILFTFGFVFAVPSYVFILPQLTHGLELGIFIFLYGFIGFYLFKGPVTLLFLMGLFIIGINNTMYYNFAIMLTIMMLLYLVVAMIILSYYFPFSSRPEHLFLTFKERFFRNTYHTLLDAKPVKKTAWQAFMFKIRLQTMNVSAKKMAVWGTKIDARYFNETTPQVIGQFSGACHLLSQQINTYVTATAQLQANPLIQQMHKTLKPEDNANLLLATMAQRLASTKNEQALNQDFSTYEVSHNDAELSVESFLNQLELENYSHSDIAGFYIYLNLHKNIYQAIEQCKTIYKEIRWANLRQNRF